jgi:tRNA dimethylallyltransferase
VKGGSVIGLLGPTGVGKTAVAVELARLLGTKIISCDSMQVYAGFPVLTNQPWGADDGRESHALVGTMDPGKPISAAEYAAMARPLVKSDLSEHGRGLVVGGSGLYMRAALAPLAASRPGDMKLRRKLEERARDEGPGVLHAELAQLDPDAAAAMDFRNVRRVIRALEGVLSDGGRWSGRSDLWAPDYYHSTLVVGLWMERDLLASRILARTERMLDAGAVEEVAQFRKQQGDEATRPGGPGICRAIGYGEIWRYIDGDQGRAETIEQIAAATRGYARRQITWLRKVRGAVMIELKGQDAGQVAREIVALEESVLDTKEP